MKSNNKIYSIVFLAILSLFLLSMFSQKKVAQPQNMNSTTQTVKNKNDVKTADSKATFIKNKQLQKQQKKTIAVASRSKSNRLAQIGKYKAYLSTQAMGIIGMYNEYKSDNPADNIFTITLDRDLSDDDKVELSYTLTGVEDLSNVTYSINDRPALGGYLIKKSGVFSKQKVEINPSWLKRGENRIQFSAPEDAAYGYKIENLSLEVENADEIPFAVNAGNSLYGNQAYIQGFVKQADGIVSLNGKTVPVKDGVFETIVNNIQNNEVTLTATVEGKTYTKHILYKNETTPDVEYAFIRSFDKTYKTFEKGKADTLQIANAELNVSDTSLLANKSLSVMNLRNVDVPAMDYGMINVTGESNGLRFLPHGEHFKQGTTVAIKYDRTKIPSGYTEDDVKTYYFDNETKHWVALEKDSVDKTLCMVVSKTTHFTDMINGVIKTPESPETAGFTPTMMNDIKAADPTAGIQMIAPPTANNSGSANLSYKIEVPPARNGMAPDLTIQYNSDGGSGWLGEGWDLNVPSITVDTRFGVPTYDRDSFETETYSLNGIQLARTFIGEDYDDGIDENMFIPDRGVVYRRNTDGIYQFYPRVITNFERVERLGNQPGSYTWRITDKNGTAYYYGNNNGVLCDDYNRNNTKKIGEWKLTGVTDIHGDSISYIYSTIEEDGYDYSNAGLGKLKPKAIYLSEIRGLTKDFSEKGKYLENMNIHFYSVTKKRKKTNNARYGFLVSNQKLLDSIVISVIDTVGNLQKIRSYSFKYSKGPFLSDLLNTITQYDGSKCKVISHQFNYYNETNDSVPNYVVSSNINNPNVNNNSIPILDFVNKLSGAITPFTTPGLLSNSNTFNVGAGLYFGVGIGKPNSINGTIGINGDFNHSNTTGNSLLIDIDGDGLSDNLYLSNKKLYYNKRTSENYFAPSKQITGDVPPGFSESNNNTFSLGLMGQGRLWGVSLGARIDWDLYNKTSVKTYLSDVNGDGLVDIVHDGKVYFNYLNTQGVPTFTRNSSLTANPMSNLTIYNRSEPVSAYLRYDTAPEDSTKAKASPLQDMVRIWQAPYSGTIEISGDIQLLPPPLNYDTLSYSKADGVRVAIQKGYSELWFTKIEKDNHTLIQPKINNNTLTTTIDKGQIIYFRLQSGDSLLSNGNFDAVTWNPVIHYISTSENIPNEIDNNGYSKVTFISSEGDIINKRGYNLLPHNPDGTVQIKGTFSKPITTGDVKLEVFTSNFPTKMSDDIDIYGLPIPNTGYNYRLVATRTFLSNGAYNNIPLSFNVNNTDTCYWFKLSSPGKIRWEKVKCFPEMHYNYTKNNTVLKDTVYAGVKYDITEPPLRVGKPGSGHTFQTGDMPYDFLIVKPYVKISEYSLPLSGWVKLNYEGYCDSVYFNTYSGDINYYHGDLLTLTHPHNAHTYFDVTLDLEQEFYSESNVKINIALDLDDPTSIIYDDFASKVFTPSHEDYDCGTMWRGWGRFEYNASYDRFSKPIQIDSLILPTDTNDIDFDQKLLIPLAPYFKTKKYLQGYSDNIKLSGDTMCAARLYNDDLVDFSAYISPTGAYQVPRRVASSGNNEDKYYISAPELITKGTNRSFSVSAGCNIEALNKVLPKKIKSKLGVNVSLAKGNGTIEKVLDYIDLNGDGYPDYFNQGKILYSNSRGSQTKINTIAPNSLIDTKTSSFNVSVNKDSVTVRLTKKSASISSTQKSIELSATIGASGGISKSTDDLGVSYTDVNGDGLPDMIINSDNTVRINLGYSFTSPITLGVYSHETQNYAANLGLGLSGGKENLNWSAGIGCAGSFSSTINKLVDMNGDGLMDIVSLENFNDAKLGLSIWNNIYQANTRVKVKLNTGNGFVDYGGYWGGEGFSPGNTLAGTLSVNGLFTYGFNAWLLKFTFQVSANAGTTNTRVLDDIQDYNADGYPDFLNTSSTLLGEKKLKVYYSQIGRTNKLASVVNSYGGSFYLDYTRSKASSDHPNGKWVMKDVKIQDGFILDGPNSQITFDFDNGKYNRREREFCGFGKVTSKYIDTNDANATPAKIITQIYDVSSYYTKGNMLKETIADGNGIKCLESENKYYSFNVKTRFTKQNTDSVYVYYTYTPIQSSNFPDSIVAYSPIKYSQTKIYNRKTSNVSGANTTQNLCDSIITSQVFYSYYTDKGNNTNVYNHAFIEKFISNSKGGLNESGNGIFDYQTIINYKPVTIKDRYAVGLPSEVTVKDKDQKTLRHMRAYYKHKDYPTDMTRVVQYTSSTDSVFTEIGYDRAGNIIHKLLPSKMSYTYTYDDRYKMYLTQISDTLGYVSKLENYDYRFGIPLKTTDINGNVQTTEIDNWGRVTKIKGPNDPDYTIQFAYHPEAVELNTDGTIKKPAYAVTKHYDVQHPADPIETVTFADGFGRAIQVKKDAYIDGAQEMIVSGKIKYDAFGRAIEGYYPQLGTKDYNFFDYATQSTNNTTPTKTEYDALDRVTKVTLPDNSITTTSYSIAENMLKTTVTDAMGGKQATFTDGEGLTRKTLQYKHVNPDTVITTLFDYDAINQLVKVTDATGKETLSEYDLAGRRTKVTHPASGVTTFGYDKAGNLSWKYTANKDTIKYAYDFNRLKSITYPRHPENNVKYTYGDKSAATNLKARLILQEDGSGAQEFSYGNMGELTQVRRTLVIPNQAVATYTTKWNYDSWNRVQSMTYPDEEIVNYHYDLGGNLAQVESEANEYIKNITYDKFDQRQSIVYGNGTVTNYTYDDKNRRLSNLLVKGTSSNNIMDNSYYYDAVGNIDSVVNKAVTTRYTPPGSIISNSIGGAITHHYHYDNLYRLTSADGTFSNGADKEATYKMVMKYDNLHNITYKKQDITQANLQFAGTLKAGYTLDYVYNGANNQQIAEIIDKSYRYEGTSPSPLGDDATLNTQTYRYDANGNMTYVGTGEKVDNNTVKVTSERKLLWDEENRLTALSDNGYVSNYIYDAAGERTVKMHGGSEGVMVNGKQAAARLGAVDFTAYVSPYLVVSPGGNYTKHIYAGSQRIASKLANGMINATNEVKAGGSNGIYNTKINLIQTSLKTEYDSLGVKYGKIESTFDGDGTNTGNLLYFYHPDHLGSSSLITDVDGNVTQHIEYVPFGETFIDERNGSWHTPNLFNAKELDEETGLYYYTHRYYDPRTSVWLSSDPLKEKFPNVSSYIYCHDNPVNRIDPDGRKDVVFNNDGTYKNTTNDNFWHNLWFGTRGIINDKNGNKRATFRFNNSDDAKRFQLKQGEKGYLRGINENFLSKNLDKLTNQGVKPAEKLNIKQKYKYIYEQSMSGGNLDYAYANGLNTYTLYLIGGAAYDNYDAGNFIWGHALKKLGVSYDLVKIGSEYNGFWNGKVQNGEWDISQPWIKRITWSGDSEEDQQAIKRGFDFPYIINW